MTPIYAGGNWYGDWWEHYSIAQAYVRTAGGHETVWFGDYNLASRTPLFNLVTAFALSLFGDHFWVYQVASTVVSSLFLPARCCSFRELRGRRAALLIAAFIFFNTWLVHDALFTWAKMTAAYLLLLSLALLPAAPRRRRGAWALHMTALTRRAGLHVASERRLLPGRPRRRLRVPSPAPRGLVAPGRRRRPSSSPP